MNILLDILLLLCAVSQLVGTVSLAGILSEDTCHCFLIIDICKLIRKELNLVGTIIAMIFICIWFSGAILCNIIGIIIFYTLGTIIRLFHYLFKRRT